MKLYRIMIIIIAIILLLLMGNTFPLSAQTGSVTDKDGNVYNTVKIGNQVWMVENLKTTKYRNGDPIPNVTDGVAWGKLTTGAYCYYDNNSSNGTTYGKLYNWYAVNDARKIAPDGWHVPTNAEWLTLVNYLGGMYTSGVGGKLKETGTSHWLSPNTGATNETGFTALPGGYRAPASTYFPNGFFTAIGENACWWCSDEYDMDNVSSWIVRNNNSLVDQAQFSKKGGIAIRCVKDETTEAQIPTLTTSAVINITQTTASGGGNIANDGGAIITKSGVCWSTSANPTISDSKTADGTSAGSFTSSITGLTAYKTYYVRAYATNSAGTGYGNVVSFTTLSFQLPILTTLGINYISSFSAKTGGNISSEGGSAITVRGVCWSTGNTPTIANSKTSDGNGGGSFTSNMSGLTENTTYYVRAYATNSAGTGYGEVISFTSGTTVTDINGYTYNTVKIGNQVWMVENLKTKKYRNGDAIENITDGAAWGNLTTGAYCNYDNNSNNGITYGRLYNWYAVNDAREIAPDGWHVPTNAEWLTLVNYLGGMYTSGVGGKLKETGTTHWLSPNTVATNETGFTALPGGYRAPASTYFPNGFFTAIGENACWWCSDEYDMDNVSSWIVRNNNSLVDRAQFSKKGGMAIRCVKDEGGLPSIMLNKNTLQFDAIQNSALPSNQIFTVSNSGSGTLNWSLSDNATWLNISPASGTNTGSIAVSVNTTNLAPGKYNAEITAVAFGATNTPQKINVSYSVTQVQLNPTLSVTPSSGQQNVTTFVITGSGYTPGGAVRRYMQNPGQSYQRISDGRADSYGNIRWDYIPTCLNVTGDIKFYFEDSTSGKSSNIITQTVITNPTCLPGSFLLTAIPECNGTTSQIRLNWTASIGATSYTIYRNGTSFQTGLTGTQYINTTITSGNSYSYYVKATNSNGSINSNTVTKTALNCNAKPDLVILNGTINNVPNPVMAGDNVTINYTIKNIDAGNAGQSITRIQIKKSSTVFLTEQFFTTSALNAGSTISENRIMTIPSNATSGAYVVYVILDYNSAIGQSDTTNDIYSASLTINPKPATTYTLSVNSNPANGGSTEPSGAKIYNSGSVVSVSASHNSGWKFTGWSGDTTSNNSTIQLVMWKSKIIAANFAVLQLPKISFPTASSFKTNSAVLGATVTSDEGSTITERGVVWSKSINPTIASYEGKQIVSGTSGQFTADISGLSPNTTYHFRAYAINSAGVGYSEDATFTTLKEEQGIKIKIIGGESLSLSKVVFIYKLIGFDPLISKDFSIVKNEVFIPFEKLPELIYISRIEIRDNLNNLIGHISLKCYDNYFKSQNYFEMILTVHNNLPNDKKKFDGWSYYSSPEEKPVTMLIPPLKKLSNVNKSNKPVLFVHGVSGCFGDYWNKDGQNVYAINPNGNTNNYDCWQFYYPYDGEIEKNGTMLGDAIDKILKGTTIGSSAYNTTKVDIVAHSMGGLVARSYIQGLSGQYKDNVDKFLMLGTPNHGSYSAYRLFYDKVDFGLGNVFSNKDNDAPAYKQMSPASDFMFTINGTNLKSLKDILGNSNSLVVAGNIGSLINLLHWEILNQQDGVVSVSSASLFDQGTILVVKNFNHTELQEKSDMIEIIKNFLQSNSISSENPTNMEDGIIYLKMPGITRDLGIMLIEKEDNKNILNLSFYETKKSTKFFLERTNYFQQLDNYPSNFFTRLSQMKMFDTNLGLISTGPDEIGIGKNGFTSGSYQIRIKKITEFLYIDIKSQTFETGKTVNLTPLQTNMQEINFDSKLINIINMKDKGSISDPALMKVLNNNTNIKSVEIERETYVDTKTSILVISLFADNNNDFVNHNMKLVNPNGQIIDSAVANVNLNMQFLQNLAEGWALYYIKEPTVGNWKIRYNSILKNVFLEGLINSSVSLTVNIPDSTWRINDKIFFNVNVDSKDAYTNDIVKFTLCYSKNQKDTLRKIGEMQLSRNGSQNSYSGNIVPLEQGFYSLLIQLSCSLGGESIKREISKQLAVINSIPKIPNLPLLNLPVNNAVNVTTDVNISWNNSGNDVTYQLQVSTKPDFSTVELNQCGIGSNSITVKNLKSKTKYYWRVNASNISGTSSWSDTWVFTTLNANPLSVSLESPKANEIIVLTNPSKSISFKWKKVNSIDESDPIKYILYVIGSNYSKIKTNIQDTVVLYDIMPELKLSSTYNWFVTAFNNTDTVTSDKNIFSTSSTVTTIEEKGEVVPISYSLLQNYPNPFNPSTNINYSIPENSFVELKVFDTFGREVETLVNKDQTIGTYSLQWEPKNITNGIYFYRIKAGKFCETRKMVYLR